tara:strand:+ start:446 stop:850 length:405 start_codon:yes stop_codon:yes gene_type:complete
MKRVSKNFFKDSYYITELELCSIRLINNSRFPWIILIPKRKQITEIFELNKKDQILLIKEIAYTSKVMKKTFRTFNLNVEKIGNIVKQLHIHVIVRSKKDSSWPLSVWVVKKKSYSKQILNKTIKKIKKNFNVS